LKYKSSQQTTDKNDNTVMLLLLHRPLWDVMVFCAFEKIHRMSRQKRYWDNSSKIKCVDVS